MPEEKSKKAMYLAICIDLELITTRERNVNPNRKVARAQTPFLCAPPYKRTVTNRPYHL